MVFVSVRGVAVYDYRTSARGIILTLSFLSVHMAEIVCIFLVEILAYKYAFEVCHSVFQGQSRTLQEQTVLQSSPVFQVFFFSEGYLELCHAQGHVLQMGRDVVSGQIRSICPNSVLSIIILLGVEVGDVFQKSRCALQ